MTKPNRYDPVVPLFLIPTVVAEGIRKRGGKLYRISVVRTHSHAYRIKYKCRVKEACVPITGPDRQNPDREQWTLSAYGVPDTGEIRTIPKDGEDRVVKP